MEIKDSGSRRAFESGAVRDITEGKGRFDLIPLEEVANVLEDQFIEHIADYERTSDTECLYAAVRQAIAQFTADSGTCVYTDNDRYRIMLGVAKHFENGAKKYVVDNWKKGIPLSSFIDSSLRHWCKYNAEWEDEDHASACIWNLLCAIWTIKNKPECIDFPRQ